MATQIHSPKHHIQVEFAGTSFRVSGTHAFVHVGTHMSVDSVLGSVDAIADQLRSDIIQKVKVAVTEEQRTQLVKKMNETFKGLNYE